MKALRDSVRDIVIQMWKDDIDCEKMNWVKLEVFDVGGGSPIMSANHPVLVECGCLPHPVIDCT